MSHHKLFPNESQDPVKKTERGGSPVLGAGNSSSLDTSIPHSNPLPIPNAHVREREDKRLRDQVSSQFYVGSPAGEARYKLFLKMQKDAFLGTSPAQAAEPEMNMKSEAQRFK